MSTMKREKKSSGVVLIIDLEIYAEWGWKWGKMVGTLVNIHSMGRKDYWHWGSEEWDVLGVFRNNLLGVGVQEENRRWRRCRTSSSTGWPLAGAPPRRSSTCHGRMCQLSTSLMTPHPRTWRRGCSPRASTLCKSLWAHSTVLCVRMHCFQFRHQDVTND